MKDNKIKTNYVKRKALKGHEAKLKENLTYALKEANDANLDQ